MINKSELLKQLKKIPTKDVTVNYLSFIYLGALVLIFSLYGSMPVFYLLFLLLAVLFILPDQDYLGLSLIIFLTMIFERHFTLSPLIIDDTVYKIYLIDIVLILTFIAAFINNKIKSEKKITFDWPEKLLLAFLFLSGLYLLRAIIDINSDFSVAFSSFKNYFFYPLIYFLAVTVLDSEKKIIKTAQLILLTAVGLIIFIFIGFINGAGLWTEFTPLSTPGIRYLAGTHAFYMMLAAILGISLLIYKQIRNPLFTLIVLALWGIGIQLSLMRHLWLAIIVALIFILVVAELPAKKIFLTYAIKAGLIFTSIILFLVLLFNLTYISGTTGQLQSAFSGISDRLLSATELEEDTSATWRGDVWGQARKKWEQNPILGIGFGHSVLIDKDDWRTFEEIRNIHNSPLTITIQMGIIGIIILISFVISVLFYAWKNFFRLNELKPYYIGFSAIIIAFIISSLFQPYLETNLMGIWFWLSLGIIRAMTLIKNDHENITS
jgi:O-antigen ligase